MRLELILSRPKPNALKLTRRRTYLVILGLGFLLCLLYQSVWIFSRTTTARIESYTTDKQSRSGPNKMWASYTVDYETYYESFLIDGFDVQRKYFRVRYLVFNPGISRSDNFASNWGSEIMFFIIWTIITSIVFTRKDIVSADAVFIVRRRWPFVSMSNNEIKGYDEHNVGRESLSVSQQALKVKLEAEQRISKEEVAASVYKYNPNAIGIIVAYLFLFYWFIRTYLLEHMGYSTIFIVGSLLIFVPLYIQNTRNPVFKMKIPNQGSLVFSSRGITYKGNLFALEDIESVVVYLESFCGFTYRERVSTGMTKTTNDGDNNKISFKYLGEVSDLTFILNAAEDYWAFKNLMNSWAQRGTNVFLQKVFEDDFIVQEMMLFS